MKLYQTRPAVAGVLGYAPKTRYLEYPMLLLHYTPYKSSLMTCLGQAIAQADP